VPLPLIVNSAFDARPGAFFEPRTKGVFRWRHFSPAERFARWPFSKIEKYAALRVRAAWRTARCAVEEKAALVVTHDPPLTALTEYFLRLAGYRGPHLAFSFNYPVLPTGFNKALHRNAFRTVDRFVIFSGVEREMYHRHFRIPNQKMEMILWGVNAPPVDSPDRPLMEGDYLCALGGNARDYATLMAAMRRLPALKLIVLARPHSFQGIDVPANVTVRTNVPLGEAMNVLKFSRFMALPLIGSNVPCGHVTLVNAMHLGKAIAITRSTGVMDYLRDGENALMCEAGDVAGMASTIERLWSDRALCNCLGDAGLNFARQHCTEEQTLSHFRRLLCELGVWH
jgi:glycosyltransferase involved in cell wall biosynthesis